MARKKGQALLILSTVGREKKAHEIAKDLVKKKLAACVTVTGKSSSYFYWENKLCSEKEHLLLIKTCKSKWAKLEKALKEMHPYSVPEMIQIEIDSGHKPYLDWLFQEAEALV